MSVFNEYARYYDLLYRDKDYSGETEYLDLLLQSLAPGARSLLNLGCGSGAHDRQLASRGYQVTGVDLSEEMLAAARHGGAGNPALHYLHGDIRSVRLKRRFEAVTSLFHVISYQVTNDDLAASFATARAHLEPGGIFVFDCWYGPGVLTERPEVRVKELEDDAIRVTRIAQPVLHADRNVVDVNYRVFLRNKESDAVREICETHSMRYLFIPELEYLLKAAGLELLCAHPAFPMNQLTGCDWNIVLAARAL